MCIAKCLFAAAFSGHYNKNDWQAWADERILKNNKVEDWIYNVSLANSIDNLSEALSDKLIDEEHKNPSWGLFSDAVIGYFYMEYLNGEMSLYELLTKSGSEADSGEATLECEEFYSILNEIDRKEKSIDDGEFLNSIKCMFEPFIKVAEQQKKELENY